MDFNCCDRESLSNGDRNGGGEDEKLFNSSDNDANDSDCNVSISSLMKSIEDGDGPENENGDDGVTLSALKREIGYLKSLVRHKNYIIMTLREKNDALRNVNTNKCSCKQSPLLSLPTAAIAGAGKQGHGLTLLTNDGLSSVPGKNEMGAGKKLVNDYSMVCGGHLESMKLDQRVDKILCDLNTVHATVVTDSKEVDVNDESGSQTVKKDVSTSKSAKGSAARVCKQDDSVNAISKNVSKRSSTEKKFPGARQLQENIHPRNTTDVTNGGGDWKQVQRRNRGRRGLVGNSGSYSSVQTVPRMASLHVTRLSPTTKAEDLKSILQKDFPEVLCEEITSKHPTIYKSFKVTMRKDSLSRAWKREIWPDGAFVTHFLVRQKGKLAET